MDWLWKCPSACLDVFGLFADRITANERGVWTGFGKSSWEIGTLKLEKAQLECDCADQESSVIPI